MLVETQSSRASESRKITVSKLAESLSRQSNRFDVQELNLHVYNSFEALAAAYIGTFFPPWETDKLFRHLAQLAYSGKYNGRWKTVQEILETGIQSPEKFQERFVELRSNEEFFGNLLRTAWKLSMRLQVRDVQRENKRRITKKVRHRGYRDKGSRRLPHEFHGDPPLKPEREDRRKLVNHPLLKEDWNGELLLPSI